MNKQEKVISLNEIVEQLRKEIGEELLEEYRKQLVGRYFHDKETSWFKINDVESVDIDTHGKPGYVYFSEEILFIDSAISNLGKLGVVTYYPDECDSIYSTKISELLANEITEEEYNEAFKTMTTFLINLKK
jgi:hypothetical protein